MKILIGYDGSSCACAALADLQRAGLPTDTEAVVMSVVDVWLPPNDESVRDLLPDNPHPAIAHSRQEAVNALEEAITLSTQAGQHLHKLFPTWHIRSEASTDSPAWALIKKAEDWGADLILVGSRGHTQLERLLLGSVSQIVTGNAQCSVRVGRLSVRKDNQPVRIVAGYDGSANADRALHAILLRKWPPQSTVKIVIATDKSMVTSHPWLFNRQPLWNPLHHPAGGESGVDWVKRMAEAAANELRQGGLQTTVVIREGDPRAILVEEAKDWQADTIFIGARGLGRFERILLGSVSVAISTRAGCSVEVVRSKA